MRLTSIRSSSQQAISWGTTQLKTWLATFPAGSLRMFEKWSFESIEWVGSVELSLRKTTNCFSLLLWMISEEPVLSSVLTWLMMGSTKGASSEKTKIFNWSKRDVSNIAAGFPG